MEGGIYVDPCVKWVELKNLISINNTEIFV